MGTRTPRILDMAAYTDVFAGTTAALVPLGGNYLDEGALRPAVAEHTTATYLSVLGLRPSLGRWFDAAEDTPGAAVVAVVGHQAWTRKFRADPSVIGRTIRIEGVPVTIVGVGPPGHRGTINIGIVTDFWLPISSLLALGAPPRALERRPEEAAFLVKARLRDGVTVAQAQAAMNILGSRLAAEYPNEDPGQGHCRVRVERRAHSPADGRSAARPRLGAARRRRACAGDCVQQPGDAAARARDRPREGGVGSAGPGRDARAARSSPADGEPAAVAGRRHRRLPPGLVGDPSARRARAGDRRRSQPRLPGPDLRGRALARHRRGIRPGAGAQGDADRTGADAARRWRDAIVGAPLAHAQERARRVPGRRVGRAAWRNQHLRCRCSSASQAARVGFAIDGVAMLETDARYAGYSAPAAAGVCEEIRRRVARDSWRAIRRAYPRPADADDGRARGRRRRHGDSRT